MTEYTDILEVPSASWQGDMSETNRDSRFSRLTTFSELVITSNALEAQTVL